jgi:hypothetical protein
MSLFTCSCCGFKTFGEPPGSFEICPVCRWHDDEVQLRFATKTGANKISLIEAQEIYARSGKMSGEYEKDPVWRQFDRSLDIVEVTREGADYGEAYPEDLTELYYWRRTTK